MSVSYTHLDVYKRQVVQQEAQTKDRGECYIVSACYCPIYVYTSKSWGYLKMKDSPRVKNRKLKNRKKILRMVTNLIAPNTLLFVWRSMFLKEQKFLLYKLCIQLKLTYVLSICNFLFSYTKRTCLSIHMSSS